MYELKVSTLSLPTTDKQHNKQMNVQNKIYIPSNLVGRAWKSSKGEQEYMTYCNNIEYIPPWVVKGVMVLGRMASWVHSRNKMIATILLLLLLPYSRKCSQGLNFCYIRKTWGITKIKAHQIQVEILNIYFSFNSIWRCQKKNIILNLIPLLKEQLTKFGTCKNYLLQSKLYCIDVYHVHVLISQTQSAYFNLECNYSCHQPRPFSPKLFRSF